MLNPVSLLSGWWSSQKPKYHHRDHLVGQLTTTQVTWVNSPIALPSHWLRFLDFLLASSVFGIIQTTFHYHLICAIAKTQLLVEIPLLVLKGKTVDDIYRVVRHEMGCLEHPSQLLGCLICQTNLLTSLFNVNNLCFLATLVALHFTLVSKWVSQWVSHSFKLA